MRALRVRTSAPTAASAATRTTLLSFLTLCCAAIATAQAASAEDQPRFVTIVLGSAGGLLAGETSAYLLAPAGSHDFVALDAGTLLTGLRHARRAGSLSHVPLPADSSLLPEAYVLQDRIKAYLLSHAHIDHVAGLVLDSTNDSSKKILATAPTIETLRDDLFNWKVWPNFGDQGEAPTLKTYEYVTWEPGTKYAIDGTPMTAVPFSLCHARIVSTAFLIEAGGDYALYFGDTGPDEVEKCDKMLQVWTHVAPIVRERKLRAVFLESSFPDPREPSQLFGHLTPSWMIKELRRLAELVAPRDPRRALDGLKVLVTHVKPSLEGGETTREKVEKQLDALNDLGLEFLHPRQGDRILF